MKTLFNYDKIKSFTALKMTYLTTFPDNHGKPSVFTGVNIHGIYCYLETIGGPTTLTISGQRSYNFGPSSSTNNDTATIQPVIPALQII